jgi:phage terminase small subunit
VASLTAKQEDFAQNIVDGCTQLEAYRRAYDAVNMSDGAASGEAYKLMNNPQIARRIQQLRDQLAERLLFPRIERLEVLKGIAQTGERDGDKINAIKVFSEMLGDNAPQKLAIEHSGETTSRTITILRAEDIVIDN